MRNNMNRNLIPLLIGLIMLTTTITLGDTAPAPIAASTSTTIDQYSSTVVSANGLSLTLSLNLTTYHSGDDLTVTVTVAVDERNSLSTRNNIRAANEWPIQGVIPINPCNRPPYPFRISILRGYYDAQSVAAVPPLQLIEPVCRFCPAAPVIVSYDFQPGSDMAAVYTYGNSEPWWSINMTAKVTSTGFWVGSCCNATFSTFTSGVYTLVGSDEWGAVVVLHFSIS
jgi:hypothetical protein